MKLLPLAFATVAGGYLLAYGIAQESPRGRVQGVLLMSENGKPLPKARVTLLRTEVNESNLDEDDREALSIKSDSDGKFVFKNIPVGQYKIEVSAKAHSASQITINVSEGEAYKTEIKLTPNAESLNAYFSQQNWLPSETPKFELTGFTPQKSVKLTVYRFDTENGATGMSRNELFFGKDSAHSWPSPNAKQLRQIDYQPVNRDVEGYFVDQVKLDGLKEGMYAVELKGAGNVSQRGFVNVTRLALVTRSAKDRVLCYAADLETGKPVTGAAVYGSVDHVRSLLGHTDASGLFEVSDNSVNRTLTAVMGASTALLDTSPAEASSGGTIAVVTDRPVYKPGDLVQFKGIVRALKGKEYSLPSTGSVSCDITDTNGNLVTKLSLPLDAHGCFHGDWTSSGESKPGYYSLALDAGGIKSSKGISIAAYRKPEFSIDVRAVKKRYLMGETGEVVVSAAYYYGAPVVGAKVQVSIYRSPKWNVVAPWDDNYDSLEGEDSGYGEYLENRDVVTDEKGEAHVSIPLTERNPDKKSTKNLDDSYDSPDDYTYQVEAYVSDASGKGSQARGTFDVSQGEYRVFARTSQYLTTVGTPVDVDISTVSLDDSNTPVANKPIHINILKERYIDGNLKVEPLSSQDAQTDAQGIARIKVTLHKRGSIRLLILSTDTTGRSVGTTLYLYSQSESETPDDNDSSRFAVSLDKKAYKVGDVAKVLIQGAEEAGASALVCVDGETILSHKVVPVASSSRFEIPVTEEMAPNSYVSVVLVKGKKFVEVSRKIAIDWTSRDLKVELATDQAKYKPGGTVQVSVRTTDVAGKPVSANLSLGCVDESIYAIRSDSFKIKNEFYPMRYDSIRTQHSFEEVYLDGGDKSTVHLAIRRKFKDTAAWIPTLQTGADGRGTTTFTLPDNLTSWRLTAVGVTDRTDVGQASLNFRTWKPLMVRLDCPSYLVKDDRQQVVIGITNDTDQEADVKVDLKATGGTLDGFQPNESHHLAQGKQLNIPVMLTATVTGETKLLATAVSTEANDAVEKVFRVLPRGMMDLQGSSGEIAPSAETTLNVIPGSDPRYGELRVQVESSVASSALSAIDTLIDYPYGCVEQTIDRFVPSLTVAKLVKDLQLPAPQRLSEVPKIAQDGLSRLATFQHSDGGWGWWQYDASNPLMTCLVLDGLAKAKELGYSSTQIRTEDAWSYVAKLASSEISTGKDSELKGYEWLALGASLAEHGDAAAAKKALSHFDRQLAGPAEWSLYARANKALGDTVALDEAIGVLHKTAQTKDGASHWPAQGWTGAQENTAFALEALAKAQPSDPLIPTVIRYFMYHREGGGWSTTLATAKVLSAFEAYLRATGRSVASGDVAISLNGKVIQSQKVGPTEKDVTVIVPRSSLKDGANQLEVKLTGQGVAYYTASLKQFGSAPASEPVAEEPGLTINRVYRLLKPGRDDQGLLTLVPSAQPVQSAQSGDVLECELTIKNDSPREFVIVEDPIPSNCHVTEQTDLEEGSDWSYWFSGLQVLEDRVGVFARTLPAGVSKIVYHLRAETPGLSHALPTHLNGMYNSGKGSFTAEGPMEIR